MTHWEGDVEAVLKSIQRPLRIQRDIRASGIVTTWGVTHLPSRTGGGPPT